MENNEDQEKDSDKILQQETPYKHDANYLKLISSEQLI